MRIFPTSNLRAEALRGLGWFVLANAALFKLITAYFWTGVTEPADGSQALAYRVLAELVHWPLLALLMVGAPVALTVLLVPKRAAAWLAAAAFGAFGCFVMLIDAVVFAQYRMHLGVYVWGLVAGGAFGEIFAFGWKTLLVAALLLIADLLLEGFLFAACQRLGARAQAPRWGRHAWGSWAAAFVAMNLWYAWADANYQVSITQESGNLPFYRPLTAKRAFHRLGLTDVAQQAPRPPLQGAKNHALFYPQQPLSCAGEAGLNVMLVVIDAWRADQLDSTVTPNIATLVPGSQWFRNHVSGGNVTRFGMFSMFYGLSGNYWWPVLDHQTPPVLMDELRRRSYDLGIFASAPLVSPEFDRTIFSGVPGVRLRTPGDRASERDRRVTSDMVAFLDDPARRGKPFFGLLWLDAVHAYDIPPDYALRFEPSWARVDPMALGPDFDRTPYLNRYRNALHFADSQVGQVLGALRRNHLMDNTLLIVTSDHGEEFNDSGKNYWGHNGNFSPSQVQVPLLVRAPGWGHGEVRYLTTHNDIAPTLLTDVLGCTTPASAYSLGWPLRETAGRRDFVAVVDYNDTGIYETDRVTLFSPFGGFPVYSHAYDRLDQPARMDRIRAVTEDMLRFSRPPP